MRHYENYLNPCTQKF